MDCKKYFKTYESRELFKPKYTIHDFEEFIIKGKSKKIDVANKFLICNVFSAYLERYRFMYEMENSDVVNALKSKGVVNKLFQDYVVDDIYTFYYVTQYWYSLCKYHVDHKNDKDFTSDPLAKGLRYWLDEYDFKFFENCYKLFNDTNGDCEFPKNMENITTGFDSLELESTICFIEDVFPNFYNEWKELEAFNDSGKISKEFGEVLEYITLCNYLNYVKDVSITSEWKLECDKLELIQSLASSVIEISQDVNVWSSIMIENVWWRIKSWSGSR